ncbi:Bug family tripartite tricarboxylate transporter substrate binding protein [Pseudorhodoferax sp.]|uniref:Bug family tripartite tricarboxylate transporter substrate binding protein n=1 Tax=Pseudorhodoferax sp. TaxID=1993553 RepID=UPI002DD6614C|nr:tripartite tricarboxylate transporter substrate binding protein [Pseudorhodoferax sp.]
MRTTLQRWAGAVLATALAAAAGLAGAADPYPSRPIVATVPFPPGGSSDAVMRALSVPLAKALGQPVVLDNKPGANGTLGAQAVARAAADGHAIVIGSVGTWAITPTLLKGMHFDPQRDLTPLTVAVRTPNVMVVSPSLPVNTVAELVAYMKRNPGKVAFASAGIGSTDHLTSVLFWQRTGTDGVHVAYKGGGAAITDVMAGHAQVLVTNVGVLAGHVKAGKLKALAVTAAARVPELAEVPTMQEAGVPGLEVYSWQGIGAPRNLPPAVLARLQPALVTALKDPAVARTLTSAGFEVVASTPEAFAALLDSETRRWKAVIDSAGIKAE